MDQIRPCVKGDNHTKFNGRTLGCSEWAEQIGWGK